ncbi:hypothetical protein DPSP01_003222 [Paraphaeosphaeria sporulosa]
MGITIIGVLAFAGIAVSSPLVSGPGFLPVQKSDSSSINILPFVASSPTPVALVDHRPRIKVTINPTSQTPNLPTWWPVDSKVHVVVPTSTSTTSTTSTSVEVSALVGVVAPSPTTTSSTTVAVVVALSTSSNSSAVVVVQPSAALTLSATFGSPTAATSGATATPAAATSSASSSSSSGDPLVVVPPPLSPLPIVSSSSALATPVVVMTPTTVSTSTTLPSTAFSTSDDFLFTPDRLTTTVTPTSTSTTTSVTTITSTSTTTTMPTTSVSTTETSSDPAATLALTFNAPAEKVKFHDEQIENLAWVAAIDNERVSDRLDEAIGALEKLANQTTDGFYKYKDSIEELANQVEWKFDVVYRAINVTNLLEGQDLETTRKGIKNSRQRVWDLELLTERVDYLETENDKWNYEGGHDPVDARLEALEEQNAYLKQKLEDLLGAEKDAPERAEDHTEEEVHE